MRIAVDATSLIGHRTGIGGVTRTYLHRLTRPNFEISAFAVSRRGAGPMLDELPPRVEAHRRPMVARPLRSLWRRGPWPPIEWWTGAIDLVWGPNYVVPPAKNAARVVMVHDLTAVHFPEMCTRDVQQMPSLLRREILDGAWINTPSQAVADDVIETLQVDPSAFERFTSEDRNKSTTRRDASAPSATCSRPWASPTCGWSRARCAAT